MIMIVYLQDNGSPPLSSETFLVIDIRDGDDLNPTFSQELYSTQIKEDYPITVSKSPQFLLLHILSRCQAFKAGKM